MIKSNQTNSFRFGFFYRHEADNSPGLMETLTFFNLPLISDRQKILMALDSSAGPQLHTPALVPLERFRILQSWKAVTPLRSN